MVAEDMPSVPAGKAVFRGNVKELVSGHIHPVQVVATDPDEAVGKIAEKHLGVTYGDPEAPKAGDPDPLCFWDEYTITNLVVECQG